MQIFKKNISLLLIIVLVGVGALIWYREETSRGRGYLTVAVLDIGQGDGIYIEAPNGNTMMIDSGPSAKVLEALGRVMPFYKRAIDIVMVSNPDKDHYAGFLDIFKTMDVGEVIEPGTYSNTLTYAEFERAIRARGLKDLIARRGMHILLDDKTDLEILFPDRDVSNFKINDGSIIAKLTYGDTCFLFGGDATKLDERYIVSRDGVNLDCEVLKINHHGSRTSTADEYVAAVSPSVAIISDGKNNRYGHPHQETLDTLSFYGVSVYRTDLSGTIIARSDGRHVTIETEK